MTAVSLTTFVDFVIASGTPRLTVVRNAKAQYEQKYQPPFDYYKQLREAIIEGHQSKNPSSYLKQFLAGLENAKKVQHYTTCVSGYTKWLGKKQCAWSGATSTKWQSGDLTVKVNPELGVRINGDPHIIKLYFKQEPLSKLRVDTILHLLQTTLPAKQQTTTVGILDVPNGKLLTPTKTHNDISALLTGEAAAFTSMWGQL